MCRTGRAAHEASCPFFSRRLYTIRLVVADSWGVGRCSSSCHRLGVLGPVEDVVERARELGPHYLQVEGVSVSGNWIGRSRPHGHGALAEIQPEVPSKPLSGAARSGCCIAARRASFIEDRFKCRATYVR